MNKLLSYTTKFVQESDWKDLALLKVSTYSAGVLTGMHISKKKHKNIGIAMVFSFIASTILLLLKIFKRYAEK